MADPRRSTDGTPPSTPAWVKVLGIIAAVVIVAIVILALVGGEHGPGRHIPGGDSGAHNSARAA
jgi:hypothetical protein